MTDILERDVRARQAQLEAARSGSQLPPPRPYDPAAEANLARANQAREAQRQALARQIEAARAKAAAFEKQRQLARLAREQAHAESAEAEAKTRYEEAYVVSGGTRAEFRERWPALWSALKRDLALSTEGSPMKQELRASGRYEF